MPYVLEPILRLSHFGAVHLERSVHARIVVAHSMPQMQTATDSKIGMHSVSQLVNQHVTAWRTVRNKDSHLSWVIHVLCTLK
jgi:hypothetical protein